MIDKLLDKNEKIIWKGKPNRALYIIGSIYVNIFMIIFGVIAYTILKSANSINVPYDPFFDREFKWGFDLFNIIPLVFIGIPIFVVFISPIVRIFSYKNVEYVVTSKRIYISSGLFGIDITNIEYREIDKLTVNVNPLEKMMNIGTIRLTPDEHYGYGENRRTVQGYRLQSIKNPYEVFNKIKQLTLDITTDHNFPNDYRPKKNSGYNTEL